MTAPQDPYSRVYWRLVDDPKFADVYGDDHAFATWLRLLLQADAMFPASAMLLKGATRRAVLKLSDAGLIQLLPGDRYRITGLDKERASRRDHASNAARVRWASGEHPASNAERMPSLAKPSLDKKSNGVSNAHGLPDDGVLILRARAILADKTSSEDQRKIAEDTLRDMGVEVAA